MTRICITGGPRTGKTTLAKEVWVDEERARLPGNYVVTQLRHTDDLIEQCAHLGKDAWSEASRIASTWLDEPGPWIIEGVAVSRALRKWHEAHPGEPPPVDRVIYLDLPFEKWTPGQQAMGRGVATVHENDVEPWLREHGMRTEHPHID
jgi:hypothetical protein